MNTPGEKGNITHMPTMNDLDFRLDKIAAQHPAGMAFAGLFEARRVIHLAGFVKGDDSMPADSRYETDTIEFDAKEHRRVLVIEDNPDLLFLIEDLVSILGYEVETASNAQAGVDLARSFQPSMIICDIGLPDMAGYEVARILRSEKALKDTYMVSMSGYGQWENIEESRDAGFNCHLVKPIDINTLDLLLTEGTVGTTGIST